MLKKLVNLSIAFTVSGCAATPELKADYESSVARWAAKSESELIAQAKQRVSSKLIDPGSAQFSNVRVLPPKGERKNRLVCGVVNSKNRLGGYAGAKPFVFAMGVSVIDQQPDVGGSMKQANMVRLVTGGGSYYATKDCLSSNGSSGSAFE